MINVVSELKKVIDKAGKKYLLYNEHDVLYLPLHIPVGISMLQFMKDFFFKYMCLLKDSRQILKKCGIDDIKSIINKVEDFQNAYIKMHEAILSCNANEAYTDMDRLLSEKDFYFIKADLKNTGEPLLLYRARDGVNWTQEEDFYHIPFNKTYLCKSCRFSIAGYPSLYLGYSKDVCKKEVRGKACSCIELELQNEISVIDLTWDAKFINSKNPSSFLQAYPIIAACYVVPFFCKTMNKECSDILQNFKEQYIFPQFVTMFVKRNFNVNGIRYFTTRDENLNPDVDKDKNIALFPKYSPNILYDTDLINNFKWGSITIL